MRTGERNPIVRSGVTVLEAIEVMTKTPGRPGATSIVDKGGQLLGFFTDGDLRRLLSENRESPGSLLIDDVMTRSPRTISPETFAMEAIGFLHQRHIDQLPVVDENNFVIGVLDVQDLLDLRIG